MQVNIFVDSLWYKKMRNNYFSQTRMGSSSTPLYYLHELHSNFFVEYCLSHYFDVTYMKQGAKIELGENETLY